MLALVRRGTLGPPFFLVHGVVGAMDGGGDFAKLFRPDQSVYFVNARGFDGAAPPYESVLEMAADYAAEIRRELPGGPYLIGGLCPGALVAMEVARRLLEERQRVGAVLMIDPGPNPSRSAASVRSLNLGLANPAVKQQMYDETLRSLREQVKSSELAPFDPDVPGQLHQATLVGVATGVAIARHSPEPFYGAVDLVLSASNARNFFDPDHAWQSVLRGPRTVHVLGTTHLDLFKGQGRRLQRLMRWHADNPVIVEQPRGPETARLAASV